MTPNEQSSLLRAKCEFFFPEFFKFLIKFIWGETERNSVFAPRFVPGRNSFDNFSGAWACESENMFFLAKWLILGISNFHLRFLCHGYGRWDFLRRSSTYRKIFFRGRVGMTPWFRLHLKERKKELIVTN